MLVQVRMGVERILGCDLTLLVFLVYAKRILIPHRVTKGSESREAIRVTLELAHVMTLSDLHSRYLMCLCCLWVRCYLCLGTFEIDCYNVFLDLDVGYDLWVVIHLGI